jgi:hypothetical protein
LPLLDLGSGNDAEVAVAKNGHGAAAPPRGAAGYSASLPLPHVGSGKVEMPLPHVGKTFGAKIKNSFKKVLKIKKKFAWSEAWSALLLEGESTRSRS